MKTNKELEKLTQAFGLLTTLHPTMEIDTRDYMGMAKQIEAHVRDLQARVAELEEQQRWIPANEFIAKEGGVYYFENLRGELRIGYFQPKNMLYAQLDHYAKIVFAMPLPKPPESEGE